MQVACTSEAGGKLKVKIVAKNPRLGAVPQLAAPHSKLTGPFHESSKFLSDHRQMATSPDVCRRVLTSGQAARRQARSLCL